MITKARLFKFIVLMVVVSLPLHFAEPKTEAGQLDDATQTVLTHATGIDERTPAVILTQTAIKPGLQATANLMIKAGDTTLTNIDNIRVLPPMNGLGPAVAPDPGILSTGGGYLIKGSLTVVKVYDVGRNFATLDDYSKYDSTYSSEAIKIDKSLQVVETASGVGELLAGGFVLVGAPEAAPLVAVFAGTKFTIKITRAMLQDTRHAYNFIRPQKLPPNATFDPIGLLNSGKPGVYIKFPANPSRYPDAFPVGGAGYWVIPLDSVKGDPDYYYVIGRTPYEVGISNLRPEIPNPGATGVQVYKPNIYLYHPDNGTVTVKLIDEGLITSSDPLYPIGCGWTASLSDGSINGSGGYLFYEAGVADTLFQKETGWLVRGGHHLEDLTAILDDYGFNAKEMADFLDFWLGMLKPDKTYVFYNQETPIVDRVMPLETDRDFSDRHRIWFYIEAYENQALRRPATIERIHQHENALVEWGGILQD